MVSVIYEYTISMRTVLSGTNPMQVPRNPSCGSPLNVRPNTTPAAADPEATISSFESGGTVHIRITKAKALKDELSSTRKRTAGGSIRPAKRHSPVKFLLGNECTSLPMARQRAVSH